LIQVLRQAAYRHGYLFITAAWLYTISFVITNYLSYNSSYKKVQSSLNAYLEKQEKTFDKVAGNSSFLPVVTGDSNNNLKPELASLRFGLFVYELNDRGNPVQLYWNTNSMAVNAADVLKVDGNYGLHYADGFFELIRRTAELNGKKYIVAGLVPVYWNYLIENKYLKSEFAGYPGIENQYEISTEKTEYPILNGQGSVIFNIKKKSNVSSDHPDSFSLFLRVLAVLFLMVFIRSLTDELLVHKGFLKALGFLLAIVVLSRVISYFIPFPFNFRKLELFDPAVYASSYLHPSLGDLLINSILFFWIVSFLKFNIIRRWDERIKLSKQATYLLASVCAVCLVLVTFGMAGLVRSLVVDSNISFDVTNFFGLSVFTLVGFIIICFLILSYFHLSHLLIISLQKSGLHLFWRIVMVVVSGLLILSFNTSAAFLPAKVATLAWLVAYLALTDYRSGDMLVPVVKSSFFLFWVILFSVSVAALIVFQNRALELEQRKSIAIKQVMQTDPSSGNLLSISIANFSDFFIDAGNFNRFKSETSNKVIKDSLIRKNLVGYLNKYDTRIYTYDSAFTPLYNEDSTSYQVIESIINNQSKPAGIPGLFCYESASNAFSYLYNRKIISKDSVTLGYLAVVVKLRGYKTEALTPELFKQVKDISAELNTNYSIAVYAKRKMNTNNNDSYAFADSLHLSDIPKFEFELRDAKGNYNELWYNAGNNKIVIIAKNDTWFQEAVTLFAYLFCSFISVIFLYQLLGFAFRARFRWINIRPLFNFDIRTQIQATIIFISLFSFIVIGIATISSFIDRFDKSNTEKLSKTIKVMANEIESHMKTQLVFDDILNLNDLGFTGDLERKIREISEIHNVDVNFYDINGNLKLSTQADIYNKQVLSEKIHPLAYYALHDNRRMQYIQKESIGKFRYLSIYVPIRDNSGNIIDYLNIPYLNSQNELNQEIANFLVTLINLNALIFLLAGAIAVLLTNRITQSFSLIGNKMKEITLGRINEEILWKRNDEIGALVNEYNKMVKKLEESAQSIARNEREGAWREMARQVAHEIKNPLTPMKLSIQYLQKAVNDGYANVKELSEHVAATLVEQIDQLSKIAGDFSQFANIGNVLLEKFDISEVLQSLVSLYQSDGRLTLIWEREVGDSFILADRVQITRLFTNLIKNAIEASPKEGADTIANIFIRQYRENNQVVIAITDEGMGIPEAIQQKIFIPNFTTKSSGTGLGLAICKGIVEKANGRIWFETKESTGTTFFVALPIATA